MNQGENAPPMHARCRCTIVAYDGVGNGQRATRDDSGKYQRIPADMSYRDWKAVYVDKSKTLDTWRAESKLAAGQLPVAASGAKVAADGFTFDLQRFGRYEDQVRSHGGSGHIKPDKIVSGHDRPKTSEPLSIIDHRDKHGKIDKRSFYDESGLLYFEVHATNHNFPKKHPFGEQGEHAHDVIWEDGKIKWTEGKELTESEREDNSDLL